MSIPRHVLSGSGRAPRPADILALQRRVGNRAVQRLLALRRSLAGLLESDRNATDRAALDAAVSTEAGTMDSPIPFEPSARSFQAGVQFIQRKPDDGAVHDAGVPPPAAQPTPAAPKKSDTPTFDQIVQEIGPALGGPFNDYEALASSMVQGQFLGHTIDRGVRPEFLKKLHQAEKHIDDEYAKCGNSKPQGFGIKSVGGFRSRSGPHGWGLAIDIDASQNTYMLHQKMYPEDVNTDERRLDRRLVPVLNRIAEFILNDPVTLPPPIGGPHQSIIPEIITQTGTTLSGLKVGRDARWAEYYDRLKKESDAMEKYFALMKGTLADRDSFLTKEWQAAHQGQPKPDPDRVLKQMWEDYALLGGVVPKAGPPDVPGYQAPASTGKAVRPFNSGADPAGGFLTIPREVVIGLGQALTRWGAVDFGGESGDVMHFDDMEGLGLEITGAKAKAKAKLDAATTPP